MNKIKLMYDVVKTLREKDSFTGNLNAEATKDEVKIFNLVKVFEKNTVSGEMKCKINTELNYEGKVVKHESSTEFNMQDCCKGRHHSFMKNMHQHHSFDGSKCCNIKDRLSMLGFLLNTFNNMKVEEKGDQGVILSININEIPEDMKKIIKDKTEHCISQQKEEQQCCCMTELCLLEDINIDIRITVNSNSEVEKLELLVSGKQKDESKEVHNLNLEGELSLEW